MHGMRLLHAADIHLDASYAGFGGLARARSDEVLAAFRTLPDVAVETRADAVLVAGDLFDGPHPGPQALGAVREVLRRFVDLCIPVFLVPGNHDAITLKLNPYRELARGSRVVVQNGRSDGPQWPVRDEAGQRLVAKHSIHLLARPRLGDPVTVETASGLLHVYGAAYDPADAPDPLATFRRAEQPGVHVALLHLYVAGVGRHRATRNAHTVDRDALGRLNVDYIALGDQHRPALPDAFGGAPACYPGSFAATDLTEPGPRGYVLVDIEPGRAPRVEHRDSGVRPVIAVEVDVSDCRGDASVTAEATRLLPDDAIPTVRLVGEPGFPLDADRVTADLVRRYGHAAVTDITRYHAAPRLAELAVGDTVAGHVIRAAKERIERAASDRDRLVAEQALRVVLRGLEVT
jgi:DNA repair protein SbcD/Mre11